MSKRLSIEGLPRALEKLMNSGQESKEAECLDLL
jgi:hypothetical protein